MYKQIKAAIKPILSETDYKVVKKAIKKIIAEEQSEIVKAPKHPDLDITEVSRALNGDEWFTGVYKGHFFQAKVTDKKHEDVLDDGRVYKLVVCKDSVWNPNEIIFSFDRGMHIDNQIGREIAALFD